MPRVPGKFNGGIPPNLVWDENNPPMKNECSGLAQIHSDECDGSCEKTPCTELEVDLMNEHRNWARLGMNTGNVIQDLFRMNNQIEAIVESLKELIPRETLDDTFKKVMLKNMRGIREANEEEIRRSRIGVRKQLFGPNGEPL